MAKLKKLFNEVVTGYDPKNRPVFICKAEDGFYVYKPGTGFTSRVFSDKADEALQEIYSYQLHDSQNNAFYREGDRAAAEEAPKSASPKTAKPAKAKQAKPAAAAGNKVDPEQATGTVLNAEFPVLEKPIVAEEGKGPIDQ
ncbi:MAG: hypothetical protein V4722_04350 [Bacteroidota bacterium]